MMHVVSLLTNIIIIMIISGFIDGESNECTDEEHSPLCFCHSSYQRPIVSDLFVAKLSLSQCDNYYSIRQCRQNRFHPSSIDFAQLIPRLANHSHCLKGTHCFHTLHSIQRCQRCQLTSSTQNDSYHTNTTIGNVPTDPTCFYLCQHDTSCGFLCLNQHVTISINCTTCRERTHNVTCRCLKMKQSSSCLRLSFDTTTERWMQKRGFPAAGFLALLILAVTLLVIAIKLIYRQLNSSEKHLTISNDHSIFSNQSYQSSPSCLNSPPSLPLQSQQF